MKYYEVRINGQNYLLKCEGELKRMGFYKTYYLEATDPEAAENLAVEKIIEDPKWEGIVQNKPEDKPVMYLDSIGELDNFEGISSLEQGYIFYPEDGEE